MTVDDLLAIGSVADATGTTVATVRYYDELGLVPSTTRIGGKRRFDPGSVGRVNFVRRAQRLGFSLDDIKAILDDTNRGWAVLVDARLAELRAQRASVDEMIAILEEVRTCGCEVVTECPRSDTTI